jgi:hypothetical protein
MRATLPAPAHSCHPRSWHSHDAGVLRPRRQRHCAAAQQQAVAQDDDGEEQGEQFRTLSALLCQAAPVVKLGTTELGRGLVAAADTPAGSQLLCVDAFSVLCVADAPVTRGAFAAGLLQDWQAVWGELPVQLATYLTSSEWCHTELWGAQLVAAAIHARLAHAGRGDWFRRLTAWLLWLSRHGGAGPWQAYKQLLPKVRARQQSAVCARQGQDAAARRWHSGCQHRGAHCTTTQPALTRPLCGAPLCVCVMHRRSR